MNKWIIRLKNTYLKLYWTKDKCWATNKDDAMTFNSQSQACQYAEKELAETKAAFIIESTEV